ncbi:hypothetical protein NQ317_007094 [Molorchus minor]|uniref:Equilibrative nucleoside transporter 3-like n=1 Tax=Molorchus minor TaxID=1323400 RepID=A0ABQ9K5L5_9CUCU|nr:hypothetical protein NQ317_007094 [Molorchus minor]
MKLLKLFLLNTSYDHLLLGLQIDSAVACCELIYAVSISTQELEKKTIDEGPSPKDTFYLVHILCLLFGLLHVLPLTFFITANDYWMYKFRDVSSDAVDLNNKTTLQTYFNSGTLIAQSTSMVIFMILSSAFAHLFKIRSRITLTLILVTGIFALFAIMIKINTDTWQTGFFALSLFSLASICGIMMVFNVSTVALVPKFPPKYMNTFLLGQGMTGVFNGCLQIICLAMGTSTETSALFYFGSGTALIFGLLILFVMTKHLAFYQYYIEKSPVETRKKMITKKEVNHVTKNIWVCLAIYIIGLITLVITHPSITGLVVSENYGSGYPWNWYHHSNGKWWLAFTVLRLVIIPFVYLCNERPRNHLSVWFPHDWQYVIIIGVLSFTHGILFNVIYLSIPNLEPEKEEAAFLILTTCVGITAGVASPFSLLGVRML